MAQVVSKEIAYHHPYVLCEIPETPGTVAGYGIICDTCGIVLRKMSLAADMQAAWSMVLTGRGVEMINAKL